MLSRVCVKDTQGEGNTDSEGLQWCRMSCKFVLSVICIHLKHFSIPSCSQNGQESEESLLYLIIESKRRRNFENPSPVSSLVLG